MGITPAEWQAISLSIQVAIVCSVTILPVALYTGFIMARKDFPGKPIIESLIHLPLVMPPVTTGYLLLIFFGRNSTLGYWLNEYLGINVAFTFKAAVLASMVVSFPLVVRSVRTAMEMVDPSLEETSRLLGAGKFKTFIRVTLPLALPGVLGGFILGFARSLGEFGATVTFAGNITGETQTIPLAIYSYMQIPGYEAETVRLVVISVLISLAAMILSEWYIKKMKHDLR
jgi:molybdate transport system permease protein